MLPNVGNEPPRTTEYVETEVTELGTPYLEVVRGAPFGKPARLGVGSTLLGRDADADLRFDVTGVSRKHARITVASTGTRRWSISAPATARSSTAAGSRTRRCATATRSGSGRR